MSSGFVTGSGSSDLLPVTFSPSYSSNAPRAYAVINGTPYAIKSFTVDKNSHGATNTGSLVVSYKGNPDWTVELFRGDQPLTPGGQFSLDTSNNPVYVQIYAGFPSPASSTVPFGGGSLRFYGLVDMYDPYDMDRTEFKLRSLAAPLTTDRISTSVQNLTTTAFLQQICAPYGLQVMIDPTLTSPLTLAQVYSQDFVTGLKNLVKWDVIQRSSMFDDVDVWEDNGTVYYIRPQNVQTAVPSLAQTLNVTYGKDIKTFHGTHAPQFSRNIAVRVHSYTSRVRQSVTTIVADLGFGDVSVTQNLKTSVSNPVFGTNNGTRTVYSSNGNTSTTSWVSSGGPAQGSNTPLSESGKEVLDISLPNLTPQACQQYAQAIWRQVSMHEYQGEFEFAVTPELLQYLNIESRITMSGYGMSAFNTTYWPRTMSESFDMSSGWTVKFGCVNHTLFPGQGV